MTEFTNSRRQNIRLLQSKLWFLRMQYYILNSFTEIPSLNLEDSSFISFSSIFIIWSIRNTLPLNNIGLLTVARI